MAVSHTLGPGVAVEVEIADVSARLRPARAASAGNRRDSSAEVVGGESLEMRFLKDVEQKNAHEKFFAQVFLYKL